MWENSDDYGFFCDIEHPEYDEIIHYYVVKSKNYYEVRSYIYKNDKYRVHINPPFTKKIFLPPHEDNENNYGDDDAYEDDILINITIKKICLLVISIGIITTCIIFG